MTSENTNYPALEVPPEPWTVGYAAFAATVMSDCS
jgi:hypothetical protein